MSKTHCICEGDAERPARMLGTATLMMVTSIDTMSTLRQQDAKTKALRRALSCRPTFSFTRLVDCVGTADDNSSPTALLCLVSGLPFTGSERHDDRMWPAITGG